MYITFSKQAKHDAPTVRAYVLSILETSRFSAEVSDESTLRRRVVKILNVRLKQSKAYCGNHPNACENGGTREEERPHRKSRYLEGADWVEFNDLLNDLLDALELDAKFYSSLLVMRKGRERRTHYGSFRLGRQYQWNKDEAPEHFSDWCGASAPDSTFPEGTPGQYKSKYFEIG